MVATLALKVASRLCWVISEVPMPAFIQAQPTVTVWHVGPLGHGLFDYIVHALDLSGCAATTIDPQPLAWLSNALAMIHLQSQRGHHCLVARV